MFKKQTVHLIEEQPKNINLNEEYANKKLARLSLGKRVNRISFGVED